MSEAEETIKRGVIEQIGWDDSVDANTIHVDVIDDTVKLSGKVPNNTAKRAAERDAYYVTGVSNVENLIEIAYSAEEITDEDIAERVANLLLWNGNITSNDITVNVNRGVVILGGNVDSYWEKRLAEELTQSATGVVDVINEVEVKLHKLYVDDDIRDDIKNALKRNPIIDEDKIDVAVEDGAVKLSGAVANYQIKHQAHKTAQFTGGVKDVTDKLVII